MRKNITYFLILLITFLVSTPGTKAQINSFSDQYLVNLFLINPAVAGTGQYGNLSVFSRQQWTGWDGAPASQSVTFQTKYSKIESLFTPTGFINRGKNSFSRVGMGGGLFHESYGVFNLTGIHFDYSYHVVVKKGRLSFGLSPSIFQLGTSTIILADPNDPYLEHPVKSYFLDFNAGVHYFDKLKYAGFSVVQLFNSRVKFGNYGFPDIENPAMNPDLSRSAYAYGGYYFLFRQVPGIKVEPMAVVKFNTINGLRFDVSTTIHLLDKFLAGVSYSYKNGIFVFTGVRFDNLSLRYLFEIPISNDIRNQFTSHTIQLSLNIGQPIK
jgi:type IX secretion system PorP/SprF family membrane protein